MIAARAAAELGRGAWRSAEALQRSGPGPAPDWYTPSSPGSTIAVWPALFALQQPDRVRWFMLSFDRTSPAEKYSYGRLHFYRQA